MSKAKELLKIAEEDVPPKEEPTPADGMAIGEEDIINGVAFSAKDTTQDVLDSLYDKYQQILWTAPKEAVEEMHLYGIPVDELAHGVGSWPGIEIVGDKIKLESGYGNGKESHIIVDKVMLDLDSSIVDKQ